MPTVSIVTQQFVTLFKSAARSLGYADLPIVVVPHPFESLSNDEARRIAREKFEEIVAKATKPKAIPAKG